MKIIIAPDSFKGSATAAQVADSLERGLLKCFPTATFIKIPVADGGEGTVEVLTANTHGRLVEAAATDPLGRHIKAQYGVLPDNTAVVEIAAASGITLVKAADKNPSFETSFGTGQLIKAAVQSGCSQLLLGLGGSATNDGGLGIMRALGAVFTDTQGVEITKPYDLNNLCDIDISRLMPDILTMPIVFATDVKNTVCGIQGATYVYGPQKGVVGDDLLRLDACLLKLTQVLERKFNIPLLDVAGLGAAGGAGLCLYALGNAKIKSGIDVVLDYAQADQHFKDATLIITGEGQIDGQSIYGKVPVGVARRGKKYGVPVIAVVGGIGSGADAVYSHGIDCVVSIVDRPMSMKDAIGDVARLVEDCGTRLGRAILIGKSFL